MSKTVRYDTPYHPQNVVRKRPKSNSKFVTIQADTLDEFAWSNALRQYAGIVPYCPITMLASKKAPRSGVISVRVFFVPGEWEYASSPGQNEKTTGARGRRGRGTEGRGCP